MTVRVGLIYSLKEFTCVQNILCLIPTQNMSPVPQGFEEEQWAYSTYHQQCHAVNTVRTQVIDNFKVQIPDVDAGSTEEMYQF